MIVIFIFILFLINVEHITIGTFFDVDIYLFLMQKYKNIIAYFIILEQVAFISLLLYQDKKIQKMTRKSYDEVHIKDIAEIWTQYNAPDDKPLNIKTTFDETQIIAHINETLLSVTNYNYKETQIFVNEVIKPLSKKIISGHLKTIIQLLNLLEQNKDCPSVVKFAKTEPNKIYADKEYISLDKETRYDIYEKISVYRHSLNVGKKSVELLQKEKGSKINMVGKLLIAALAHDIGKIKRYEMRETGTKINFAEYKEMPHQNISSILLYDSFKDCPNLKEIAEAVQRHHSPALDKDDILLKLLIESDKQTRDMELDKYRKGEDICDLSPAAQTPIILQEPNKPSKEINKTTPQENKFFLSNFKDEIKKFDIQDTALMSVDIGKDLMQEDFNKLAILLEKELNLRNVMSYANKQGFYFFLNPQKDRMNMFNLAYDVIQRIKKSDFKECFVGFIMAKEAKSADDMIEKVNIALDKAKNSKAIIDFKDIQAQSEKIVIRDIPQNTQTEQEPQQQIQDKKKESKKNDKKEHIEELEVSDELLESNTKDDVFAQMQNLTKQIKVHNPASEEAFDIERLENQIFEKLAKKINTFSSQNGFFINSISFKKFVLFTKRCLIETLAEILQSNENIEKKINYFIRYYRNHENENKRYIWFVGVEKGYYESMYYISDNKQNAVKNLFVPFEAKMAFNLSIAELENMKNSSELSNYKVWEFSKDRK